jgi:hypothetical protein
MVYDDDDDYHKPTSWSEILGFFTLVLIVVAAVLAAKYSQSGNNDDSPGYSEKKYPNGWVSSKDSEGHCASSVLDTSCVVASLDDAKRICNNTPKCSGIWARSSWFDASNKTYYTFSKSNEVENQPTATNATYYQKL